jgi:hypothetical protein
MTVHNENGSFVSMRIVAGAVYTAAVSVGCSRTRYEHLVARTYVGSHFSAQPSLAFPLHIPMP